jgi:transcriptional regulator with XRE-family HTH domain
VCKNAYPGTREGFILVDALPPIPDTAASDGDADRLINGERRRAELADFLRRRRADIQPEDVGLPAGGRRRTPGLRREEVAQLAGVGTTWYTWLEQGRDVRASLEVLESLARALQLTPAERSHLLLLGRGREAPAGSPPAETVSPTLRRLVANLGPNPAYVVGRRMDYLAWNLAARVVITDFEGVPPEARNHLWLTFNDPRRRELFADWDAAARTLVAKFRADHARHLGDPAFEQLVQALRDSSRDFCRAWKRHEVAQTIGGRKQLHHPVAGTLVFEHAAFHPVDEPEQRLILYSPVPGTGTAEKVEQLCAEVGETPELALAAG